jgi:hypothetical protein
MGVPAVAVDSHGDARPMLVRAGWYATFRGYAGDFNIRVRSVIKDERKANVKELRYAGKRYLAWGSVKLADSVVKVSIPHPLHSHPYFFCFVHCIAYYVYTVYTTQYSLPSLPSTELCTILYLIISPAPIPQVCIQKESRHLSGECIMPAAELATWMASGWCLPPRWWVISLSYLHPACLRSCN